MISLKDGELVPVGQARNRAKGMDKLFDFVKNAADIQDLAVVYNTMPEEAQKLAERIGSIFDKDKIIMAKVGPALGVHMGPGMLIVVYRGK